MPRRFRRVRETFADAAEPELRAVNANLYSNICGSLALECYQPPLHAETQKGNDGLPLVQRNIARLEPHQLHASFAFACNHGRWILAELLGDMTPFENPEGNVGELRVLCTKAFDLGDVLVASDELVAALFFGVEVLGREPQNIGALPLGPFDASEHLSLIHI